MGKPRFNPTEAARRQFLEIPDEPYFFPPVGQGRTGFSSYVSPDFAAASADERDQRETSRARNQVSRLEMAGRVRTLPFTTNADIAAAKLRERQAALDEADSPFMSEARREKAMAGADEAAMQRRQIPGDEGLHESERATAMDKLRAADPHQDRLTKLTDNPRHHYAYESFLRQSDPSVPKAERQRKAFTSALRLAQDQEAVDAIETAEMDGTLTGKREDFISDEVDADGIYLGPRIQDKADRAQVARVIAQHRNKKLALAQRKEERLTNKDYDTLKLRALTERKSELAKRVADYGDADAVTDLEEINSEIDLLWRKRKTPPAGERSGVPASAPAVEVEPPIQKPKNSHYEEARDMALGVERRWTK